MTENAGGASIAGLIPPFINFSILVGALYYFLKEPVKEFVAERHSSLKDELDRVQLKLVDAQKQYQEYSQRLSTIDAEVSSLLQQARMDADSSRIRLLTEAKRMADQMVIDSKRMSESMMTEFKNQIRSDLANQVVRRAETILRSRLTGDVKEQLKKDFSKQMEMMR